MGFRAMVLICSVGVHGLELLEFPLGQGLVDIVPALMHDLSCGVIGNFHCEATVTVILIKRDNLFDLHGINDSIAVDLRAETNDPISNLRCPSDCWFAVCKSTATPERIWRESRVMRDNV